MPHASGGPRSTRRSGTGTYLEHLIEHPDTSGLRTEHGYLLALDRRDHLLVDDFVVTPDEHWPTEGVALLEHARRRPGRLRVVVPAAEVARLEAVQAVGLTRGRDLVAPRPRGSPSPSTRTGEHPDIEVDGARGRLVPAPPIYDPGGPVLLVTELESTDALARIEEVAARAAPGSPW